MRSGALYGRFRKWRFTSPTHTVLAFDQALKELAQEGGVAARFQRYQGINTSWCPVCVIRFYHVVRR